MKSVIMFVRVVPPGCALELLKIAFRKQWGVWYSLDVWTNVIIAI